MNMTLESQIDPATHYQVRRYLVHISELKEISKRLNDVYYAIDDMTGGCIKFFAVNRFTEAQGFISRLQNLCQTRIDALIHLEVEDNERERKESTDFSPNSFHKGS
jgi:hypothetical protein